MVLVADMVSLPVLAALTVGPPLLGAALVAGIAMWAWRRHHRNAKDDR